MTEPLGAITRLNEALSELPGIGPKSAERLTHFLLTGDRQLAIELSDALRAVVETIHPCPECFNLTDQPACPICSDPRCDAEVLCVIETPRDLALLERTGSFRGKYHVL